MDALLALSRAIDRVNLFVGRAVSWLVLVVVLISAGNAMSRKLFDVSSNAWLEIQWYLFSAIFLLAAGYTLLQGEHVKVDVIFGRLRRRTQLWIELIGTLFFLMPFSIIPIFLTWPIVADKFASHETSGNAGGLILWPVWILIPIGFFLLGLQGISELIKRIAILTGRLPDTAAEVSEAEAAPL
jgi:TRAP-type mannitol/chloroaromatic compound transport system permease small subunit